MLKNIIVLGGLITLGQAGLCKPKAVTTTDSVSEPAPTETVGIKTTADIESSVTIDIGTTTTAEATTTTVEETTSTVSVPDEPTACAIDTKCPASGFNIDYYSNVFEEGYGTDELNVPASYYITENLTPLDSSVTDVTYFPQDYMSDLEKYPQTFPNKKFAGKAYYNGYKRTLNGDITVDANNFTLVYQGYYRAPSTGTYELCIQADNANTLFFGQGSAFECGTGEPSIDAPALVLAATGYHFKNPIQCGTVDLIKGRNYPVRNVMGNKNAVSMFEFTVKAPGEKATHNFAGQAYPIECGIGK